VDAVRRIADAVLYEGYLLWPYRKSAMKNQRRWTFGGVYPPAHSAAHPDDPDLMQAECLVVPGPECSVEVAVRFLHVVELEAGDGATEREIVSGWMPLAGLDERVEIAIDAGSRWRELRGTVEITSEDARLSVRIRNETDWSGPDREDALRQTFCSTHAVLRVRDGEFVSLTDPPAELSDAAASCTNVGCWPVLVGEDGDRSTLLCSPIILSDYPQVAPESPGDLFDGGEIDELLVLNILALTDEEKREMRESDPRAREILERTERLSEEELMRLHGAIREFGMARR
jgi:hypothetical protein